MKIQQGYKLFWLRDMGGELLAAGPSGVDFPREGSLE